MKFLLSLSALFLSLSSQAAFHPGEYAEYSTELNGRKFDLRNQILSVDELQGTLQIRQGIYENGVLQNENIVVERIDEHLNNESIFTACLHLPMEYQARYEMVFVPAGSFNTCHISILESNGSRFDGFYGDVVFGIIKATRTFSPDGSNFNYELKNHFSF